MNETTVATWLPYTAQKMKFPITDLPTKCDQIRSKLRIRSHLLNKSVIKSFIFCTVIFSQDKRITLEVWKIVYLKDKADPLSLMIIIDIHLFYVSIMVQKRSCSWMTTKLIIILKRCDPLVFPEKLRCVGSWWQKSSYISCSQYIWIGSFVGLKEV